MTVLKPTDRYHVGLTVDVIDTSATCLTAVNGCGWTKPDVCTLAVITTDRKHDAPFKRTTKA